VVARLSQRRPQMNRPSPLSTAVLVRLAGRVGGMDGLAAAVPFLSDESPLVQAEAAEAIEDAPFDRVRNVVLRLAEADASAPFWEPLVDLIASWEEPGAASLLADLLGKLRDPSAQASLMELLPFAAEKKDAAAVRRALERFRDDRRAVPGAETVDGPVTFSMLAAEALEALAAALGGNGNPDRRK